MKKFFESILWFKIMVVAVLFFCLVVPAFSQDAEKYSFGGFGTGFTGNVPGNVVGTLYAGFPAPGLDRFYLISSLMISGVNEGGKATLFIGGQPLQAEFREYVAFRFFTYKRLTLYGLAGPGFSALPGPDDSGVSIKAGFGAGGLLDFAINDKLGINFGPVMDWNSIKENDFAPFVTFRVKL